MARAGKDHFALAIAGFRKDLSRSGKHGSETIPESLIEQLLKFGTAEEKAAARKFIDKQKIAARQAEHQKKMDESEMEYEKGETDIWST